VRRVAIVLLAAAAVCAAAAADTVRSRAEPGWGGYSPVWWPDGSRIVYSRQYQPAKDYPQYHVAFVRPDGSEFRELPRSKRIGDAWDLVPAVSPGGKQMLLTRAAYGPYYNLVVRDVATGAERNLTPKNGEAAGGNWSRDGMRITYSTRGDKIGDEWTPYTARPDGTDARAVAAPSTSVHVSYLPGGNLVVLQRNVRELGSSISVVPAAGGPERTLTPKNQREWSLAGWSPDGSRLLVVRRPDESDVSLWSVPVDGTPMRLLVKGAEDGAWSPDGTRLVYVGGYFTKRRGLFLARADGSGARRVRATGAEPAWAPDGRTIAYVSDQIFLVRPNGTRRRQLTHLKPGGMVNWFAWTRNSKRLLYGWEFTDVD
jgi:Tol biopolymer transport system component